ncbi:50S ribosomal protein L22 [Candidatus Gottesmanbacteria bacterium]|nr:50S ribosomal protein L22 [Candidatus Gottesmanbacteria bacterium]
MEIKAVSKYIRVSPRKLKLIAQSIRSLKPQKATEVLAFMPKSGALEFRKVILSALANAKSQNATINDLNIASIEVLTGPAMKRFRAVSRGMAHAYKKRMSHIQVVLSDVLARGKATKMEVKT